MIPARMHACIPTYLHPYITVHTYIRIYVPFCWRLVSLFSKTAILKKACKNNTKQKCKNKCKCKNTLQKNANHKSRNMQVQKRNSHFCSHLSCILPRFLHVFFDIMFVQLVPGLICFFGHFFSISYFCFFHSSMFHFFTISHFFQDVDILEQAQFDSTNVPTNLRTYVPTYLPPCLVADKCTYVH